MKKDIHYPLGQIKVFFIKQFYVPRRHLTLA